MISSQYSRCIVLVRSMPAWLITTSNENMGVRRWRISIRSWKTRSRIPTESSCIKSRSCNWPGSSPVIRSLKRTFSARRWERKIPKKWPSSAIGSYAERVNDQFLISLPTKSSIRWRRSRDTDLTGAHSAAYALVSFQTAYLKAHYHVEFMAALMNHEMDDSDKTLKNLNECRKAKIEVLPPTVNLSQQTFSVEDGKIRYGLEAIKGIGEKAVHAILTAREEGGAFQGLEDLVERADMSQVNRRVMENFVRCGAFDFSGVSRREMFDALEDVLRAVQLRNRDKDTNQMSLFGAEELSLGTAKRRWRNLPEWPVNQKLAFERESLGFYISGHPLEKFRGDLKRLGAFTTEDIKTNATKGTVKIGGVVTALKLKNTKKGDRYASFTLEDWLGTIETLVWPDVYRQVSHLVIADDPVLITARAESSQERNILVVEKMESLIAIRDRSATQGVLVLRENDDFGSRADSLMDYLQAPSRKVPAQSAVRSRG